MISKTHRATTYARDGYRCLKCGTAAKLTIDHIIPLSKGGKNSVNNYQTLCENCNRAKGSKTIDYRKDIEALVDHLKFHGIATPIEKWVQKLAIVKDKRRSVKNFENDKLPIQSKNSRYLGRTIHYRYFQPHIATRVPPDYWRDRFNFHE